MLWFSLDADGALAPGLAVALSVEPAPHEDRAFEDGEHKLRPLVDPAGTDCYVLHGLHGDARYSPHDKICRLLMFAATLRDHGATRVTALVPYLAYARKDRQTKPFDPLGLRYVAQMTEAAGIDRLVVLEAHNVAALQNAFRCPVRHLDAHRAFDALLPGWAGVRPLAVASPDPAASSASSCGARRPRRRCSGRSVSPWSTSAAAPASSAAIDWSPATWPARRCCCSTT